MPRDEKKEKVEPIESEVVLGPDIMLQLWEITRSNRAAGRPSMAKLKVIDGGAMEVYEIRIAKREDQLNHRDRDNKPQQPN